MTYGFSRWGGGIDFIRYICTGISAFKKNSEDSIQLVLPGEDFQLYLKKFLIPARNILKMTLERKKTKWQPYHVFSEDYFRNTFSDLGKDVELSFSGSSYSSQLSAAVRFDADVIFPCIQPPPIEFDRAWIGYIADFQHRHLPYFFTENECLLRDRDFSNMLHRARHVIVNAQSVIEDAKRFIGDFPAQVHVLPFSPCPQIAWLEKDEDMCSKYKINKPYFMISNQFWRHKDHATAFRGFARFIHNGGDALLVCTGDTKDYRFPDYFEELQNLIDELDIKKYVYILGHIPKIDQINLVKTALAMVQPTLFEGGPGGGAAYDAIALGVPVIASNIPVNREMNAGDISYFVAKDADSLMNTLIARGVNRKPRPSNDKLLQDGIKRKNILGQAILDIVDMAFSDGNLKLFL